MKKKSSIFLSIKIPPNRQPIMLFLKKKFVKTTSPLCFVLILPRKDRVVVVVVGRVGDGGRAGARRSGTRELLAGRKNSKQERRAADNSRL